MQGFSSILGQAGRLEFLRRSVLVPKGGVSMGGGNARNFEYSGAGRPCGIFSDQESGALGRGQYGR